MTHLGSGGSVLEQGVQFNCTPPVLASHPQFGMVQPNIVTYVV